MVFHDFEPLRPARKQDIRILAFDTEDNGRGSPDNFLCASFYDGDRLRTFWDRDKARKFMFTDKKKNTYVFAHNLAYDLNNIDYPEGSVSTFSAGSRLIGGHYNFGERLKDYKSKDGTIRKHITFRSKMRFVDTSNFFVGKSIEELGEMLGFRKIKYDIKKIKDKTADDLNVDEKIELARYCERDAEICYETARFLFDLVQKNNTRFRSYTAASLAMAIFRTNFLKAKWHRRRPYINDYERLSYYGGRTEVFDYRYFDDVEYEDITSSYPTAMKFCEFPWPGDVSYFRTSSGGNGCATMANLKWPDIRKYEGVSLVRVEVPYMHIPPLPYRRPEDYKLIFPYGEWTAAYTHPELRMAEKYGVKIKKVHEALIYSQVFTPFADYVDDFYGKKESTDGIEREFYKLMLNGLSGKFGEKRNIITRVKFDSMRFCNCSEYRLPGSVCRDCKGLELRGADVGEEDHNGWVTIRGGRLPDPKHTFPVLIAYTTAYGRIKLYEERLSKCDAIYCDTDSCVSVKSPGINIGGRLGQWTKERYDSFCAFAPKFYNYVSDGEKKMKLKGVPRKHKTFYVCQCGREYENKKVCVCGNLLSDDDFRFKFERPLKLGEAIVRKLAPNSWYTVYKKVRYDDTKRLKMSNGKSKPYKVIDSNSITTFNDLMNLMGS